MVQDGSSVIGVLRNNYYVMQINSISGFGLPIVPGTLPSDPDNPTDPNPTPTPKPVDPVEEDAYISVSVKVLEWSMTTSEHNL